MTSSVRTVPPPLRVGPVTLHFEHRSLIMGVINVTPDSFSDGGVHLQAVAAVEQGLRMLDAGADILDVGGESTRPGAPPVPIEQEMQRVLPVVEGLARATPCAISIDTRNAATARAAVQAGAGLINDVSAGGHDADMLATAAQLGAAVVLMHMRGTPQTMQHGDIHYDNVVHQVGAYLRGRADLALAAGIPAERILLDPGFGFGKTVAHNLELMLGLPVLARAGFPVVWGPSRKSTLGALSGGVDAARRLAATVAACVMGADRGAHVLRVHDVGPVRQALAVVDAARGAYIAP